MTLALACLYCIDGNTPAGTDDVLGELYERCPFCIPVCDDCGGLAVFPAAYHCLVCVIRVLLTRHYAPILCPGCTGLITVIALGGSE